MKKEHFITVAVLILLWGAAAAYAGNDILIPYPYQTFLCLVKMLQDPVFYASVFRTLVRVSAGFMLSLTTSLAAAVVCGESRKVRLYLTPVIALAKTIPNISYIIIALVWLGAEGSVTAVTFMILFPLFINGFLNCLDEEDNTLKQVQMLYPEKMIPKLAHKTMPQLLPEILRTGRTAASMGFKVGVMAEILGSAGTGIGRQLAYSRVTLNTAGIFAWTIVMILITQCIDHLFNKMLDRKIKEETGWKS